MEQLRIKSLSTLGLAIVLVGIISGIGGMLLGLLLRIVQHSAFGYSLTKVISSENFLEGVRAAAPSRRFLVVALAGMLGAAGWGLLRFYKQKIITLDQEVVSPKTKMAFVPTMTNIILQIITVGLGSPLGREVAPRELSVFYSSVLVRKLNLTPQEIKTLLGCAAGAGLAAIYNVPLGGALFSMEMVIKSYKPKVMVCAFLTSAIATVISWYGLGNHPQYHFPPLILEASLCVWALFAGPIIGFIAIWFSKICQSARSHTLTTAKWPLWFILNFVGIAIMAMYYPALLGNGKSPARLEFGSDVGLWLSFSLLCLRIFFVYSTLKVGAKGGLLTPSLANGALLGAVLGYFWNLIWPNAFFEGFALIGAAAFLAVSQRMPLTAIILIFEFTHVDFRFLVPILLSVGSALAASFYFEECHNQ